MRNKKSADQKEKKERLSFREAFALNKRAVLLWCGENPMLFVSAALHSAIAALVPFLTIYFSARLLDELAGERRPPVLTRWVVILLTADALAYLLKALVYRWKQALYSTMYYQGEARISRKILSMDFCAAEDVSTHDLVSQLRQREMWSGWGPGKIYEHFEQMVEELLRMIGGAALTVSLFRLPVPEQAGRLTLLNHPLFLLLLLLLLAAVTVLSPYLSTLAQMRMMNHDEEQRFGNRLYFFCMDLFKETKRALDMRIYRQDLYGIKQVRGAADPRNGTISGIRRDARGWM